MRIGHIDLSAHFAAAEQLCHRKHDRAGNGRALIGILCPGVDKHEDAGRGQGQERNLAHRFAQATHVPRLTPSTGFGVDHFPQSGVRMTNLAANREQ